MMTYIMEPVQFGWMTLTVSGTSPVYLTVISAAGASMIVTMRRGPGSTVETVSGGGLGLPYTLRKHAHATYSNFSRL